MHYLYQKLACLPLAIFALNARAAPNLGVALSMGLPDLLNFQAQFLRVKWLRFGYGIGTQPIEQVVQKFAKIDPTTFVYSVNETYEVYPKVNISLRTLNSFIRIFPATESFYIESKYTIWKIEADVQAYLRNKVTRTSTSVGSVSFRILQPMLGGGIGYQAIWESGYFLDYGLGAQYLFKPNATYWIGGLLGSGLSSSVVAPEISAQVADKQTMINKKIDESIRKMRETVTLIPNVYFSSGWTF